MHQDKICPSIWFCSTGGDLSKIIDYYQGVFHDNFVSGHIIPLGDTPSGNTEMCEVKIFGQKYVLMSTENEHHALNDAISLIVYCEDQNEIDRYWNYFTEDGEESQCGWCIDKYRLRWQILPKNLGELMRNPNAGKVMMAQKKIVIAEYLAG